MRAAFPQPSPPRRWSAICIELLPLLVLPLWLFVTPYGQPSWLAWFKLLVFTTGIGWLIAGRWRAGVAASLGRLAVLAVPFGVSWFVFLSGIECSRRCLSGTSMRVVTTLIVASFVATTLASAGWLAWSTRPNPKAGTGDDKRVLAIALELLPLVATGVWPFLYSGVGAASFVVGLAFTSGLGWLVLGRWAAASFVVLGRGAIIACLFGVVYAHRDTVSTLVLTLSFIVYASTTMGSAAALAWMSQKSRPPTAVG